MENKEKYIELVISKVENLKSALDNNQMSIDDVPEEYITFLNLIYELEIKEAQKNIEILDNQIENYKVRMRNAIDYLKSKK